MKNSLEKLIARILPVLPLVLPSLTFAQQFGGPPAQQPPLQSLTFNQLTGIGCTLVAWLFTILIVVAVILIIIAAFYYLTAGGDEEKIKAANHRLIYAAVAVAVAIIARAIPLLVGNFFGASFTGC